jgi:hypothetical protein
MSICVHINNGLKHLIFLNRGSTFLPWASHKCWLRTGAGLDFPFIVAIHLIQRANLRLHGDKDGGPS